MELNVTHMIEDADDMPMLSGSIAELGNSAGAITWNNSLEYAKSHPLLANDDEREEARNYFGQFGAWSDEEINAWSNEELEALVSQFIAGDIREMESYDTYEDYQANAEKGHVSGNLFKTKDGRWYFYLGS